MDLESKLCPRSLWQVKANLGPSAIWPELGPVPHSLSRVAIWAQEPKVDPVCPPRSTEGQGSEADVGMLNLPDFLVPTVAQEPCRLGPLGSQQRNDGPNPNLSQEGTMVPHPVCRRKGKPEAAAPQGLGGLKGLRFRPCEHSQGLQVRGPPTASNPPPPAVVLTVQSVALLPAAGPSEGCGGDREPEGG